MCVKDKRDESVSVCKRVMERERMGEWENANGRKLTRAEVIVVVLALRVAAVAAANFVFASHDEQKPKTRQPKFSCLPRFAHAQEIEQRKGSSIYHQASKNISYRVLCNDTLLNRQ